MTKRFLTVALLLIALRGAGQSVVEIPFGFMKPEGYLDLPLPSQQDYVAGVFDGIILAPLFATANENELGTRFAKCMEGKNLRQVNAITLKFTQDHPKLWDSGGMNTLVYQAILDACPGAGPNAVPRK